MTNNKLKTNADYLATVIALTSGGQILSADLRRAAGTAIRELVIRNEQLQATLGNRELPAWVAAVEEDLLPQFRVHMATRSGTWPQATETVFLGSASRDDSELRLRAFAKLKQGKYHESTIDQWMMVEAVEDDHFGA